MLARAPTSRQGRNVYTSEPHLWNCSKGCLSKARLDETNDVVNSIHNGGRDNKGDANPLVVTYLQGGSIQG